MTFSNVNIFKTSLLNLRANTQGPSADKITSGGGFSPTTQEAIAIMRSNVDNQWENGYIVKYQSLMQNRLNRLKQDLTNSYKAILEMSAVQQIREDADQSNSALTDVYGNLLSNSSEAFKNLKYYKNETEFITDDTNGIGPAQSAQDGVPSFLLGMDLKQYGTGAQADRDGNIEMRKLYVTGPALQITNAMKVALRTEEVPPKYEDVSIPIIGDLIPSNKPFTPGQKVAEYSADVKSGGFWTTLNYLYNFAPRELKYSYPTAYSTTSEEAGSRQLQNGSQAVLFNSYILDARDVLEDNGNGATEHSNIPSYTANDPPPVGARVKWASSNANDGYTTERSPIIQHRDLAGNYYGDSGSDIESPIDTRSITRRVSDNDEYFKLDTTLANATNNVKSTWTYPTNSPNKITMYGDEESAGGEGISIDNKIKWEYNHDGIGSADFNQNGSFDDVHPAKAIFINHYTVQTQSVELNSSSQSYGGIKAIDYNSVTGADQKTLRSTGIDGSAEHVFNDANKDKIQQNNSDEKLMLSGSNKISKNFDGKFVSNLYNLSSFNGQNITTGTNNPSITSKNDQKVVIAEYEGFRRADSMTKGISDDFFSRANNDSRQIEEAEFLAKQLETEINASKMVDTDWHYSEYLQPNAVTSQDKIMFRKIDAVSYSPITGGTNSIPVKYDSSIIDGDGTFNNVTVGFRKTFTLKPSDFQDAIYSPPTNADIYINTPTYVAKDVFVDIVTTNASTGADLIVNGQIANLVSTTPAAGGQVTKRYNLRGLLQEGDNVIAAQSYFDLNTSNGGSADDSFKLVASSGNQAPVNKWIQDKISTDRAVNYDQSLDKLNPTNLSNPLSAWQSKIMVRKIEASAYADPVDYYKALDTLGSTRTATKVKDNNSFALMLTEALNKKEYQDLFNMGILSSILGKSMIIKAQVNSPSGGSVNATMDVQFDPINNKFVLVQNLLDAYSG